MESLMISLSRVASVPGRNAEVQSQSQTKLNRWQSGKICSHKYIENEIKKRFFFIFPKENYLDHDFLCITSFHMNFSNHGVASWLVSKTEETLVEETSSSVESEFFLR